MNRLILRSCLLVALLGPVTPITGGGHLEAQQGPESRKPARVPVTLVLVDSIPGGTAPFRILRRVDVAPHDVILLLSGADPAALSEAIGDLLVLRSLTGDTTTAGGAVRVRHRQAKERTPRPVPWAGRVMSDLQRAQPRHLPGVGTVPAVEVWLPPQRKRGH